PLPPRHLISREWGVRESSRERIQRVLGFSLSPGGEGDVDGGGGEGGDEGPGQGGGAVRADQAPLLRQGAQRGGEGRRERLHQGMIPPVPRPRSGARRLLVDATRRGPVSSGLPRASWASLGFPARSARPPGGFRRSRGRFRVA
uniref:Uncharacterized protein n=1 Tax=Aegilops tauschii subsp. strangulata TaxID=200361 RepID=A0A453GZY0_AEGTS